MLGIFYGTILCNRTLVSWSGGFLCVGEEYEGKEHGFDGQRAGAWGDMRRKIRLSGVWIPSVHSMGLTVSTRSPA